MSALRSISMAPGRNNGRNLFFITIISRKAQMSSSIVGPRDLDVESQTMRFDPLLDVTTFPSFAVRGIQQEERSSAVTRLCGLAARCAAVVQLHGRVVVLVDLLGPEGAREGETEYLVVEFLGKGAQMFAQFLGAEGLAGKLRSFMLRLHDSECKLHLRSHRRERAAAAP